MTICETNHELYELFNSPLDGREETKSKMKEEIVWNRTCRHFRIGHYQWGEKRQNRDEHLQQ
jgi:hypothetical protein